MLERFSDAVARTAMFLMWIGFAALIATVAMQVVARNLLQMPMIWTGDLAQLLFIWLIFVGAAVGLRRGAHYTVDILPRDRAPVRLVQDALSVVAAVVVIYILIWHGWTLTQIRSSGSIQSLGISQFWSFVPMPVSGLLMALFTVEAIARLLAGKPVEVGA